MNKLTLQINNLSALERLIGGDSQIEVELRNSVAQSFAEKHIKALANSDAMSTTLHCITEDIKKQVSEKCEKEIATFKLDWLNRPTDIKLNASVKSEIDRQVRLLVQELIENTVNEAIKMWASESEIKKQVEQRFTHYTKRMIDDEIVARLNKVKSLI